MRHTYESVKALIVKCILEDDVNTFTNIYKNPSTKWIANNLDDYDVNGDPLPYVPCSEKILRAYQVHGISPVPLAFDDLINRMPMYINVFGREILLKLIWQRNEQWVIDNGYFDYSFAKTFVRDDPYRMIGNPELFKRVSDLGAIDDYLALLVYDMTEYKLDPTVIRTMLEKCEDMDLEYMSIVLVNNSIRPHMKIMFDRRIYPKLDDYIRFFDDLHTMMNCFDAYTLTELSKIDIDRALWFPKIMIWRMVTIWPYNDIRSSSRSMSLSDIVIFAD